MERHHALASQDPSGRGGHVADRACAARAPAADHLADAVEGAPRDERPPGPVPQPAEQHRDQDVHRGAQLAVAAPAERDVEVVAQPSRQRHVPPTPEVPQRDRRVRAVEVLAGTRTRAAARPDRDVRVRAEVGVDHDRVRVDRDEHLETAVRARRPEHRVDDLRREVAGHDDLLEQAARDQEGGARQVDPSSGRADGGPAGSARCLERSARRPGAGRRRGTRTRRASRTARSRTGRRRPRS